ncbi:hypothetical protein O181_059349 [Austropuccinia psidii MF-1]|uniref:Integrase catalytic domain-containing protein n=1 Tax=Austropuccinia psidii MF-1 TaxID=1389203 RepID=A0A9Q3EE77_9BASI|nr:hypothetical protein [Austropuccinia psidii MF-1]
MYIGYHQEDWHTWLPLAEFSYNNAEHSPTKQSLFFTVYGRDPQFDSAHITQDTPSGKLLTGIQSVQQQVKREFEVSINRLKRYADKSRAIFNKFSTYSYYLKLSSQWKLIHPVFHISLLEQVKTSTIPTQNQEPPPPIRIEEEEWEVSKTLDSKVK